MTNDQAGSPNDGGLLLDATLSDRGRELVAQPPMAPYIRRHFELAQDRWDAVDNPDGYIPLCVAENRLVWDLIEPRMNQCRAVAEATIGYDAMVGSEEFRATLADMLAHTFLDRRFEADQLVVLNGAGSVLELLFHVIANPGDGVLVPTPSYTGFWADLETRDQLKVIAVPRSRDTGFALTPAMLDAAVEAADRPVAALLYTNPDNPLGRVAPVEELEQILDWAEARSVHLVVDEIYALSVFATAEFETTGSAFTSVAKLRPSLGERLHLVWAFSKDFALSGLRAGVLISENDAVLRAVDGLAYWAAVSGDTQSLLRQMVADPTWVADFVAENQRRLGTAYRAVTGVLDEYGVGYVPAQAGFFFLVDLRPVMTEPTWDEEDRIWTELVDQRGINLTPGSACRSPEPGLMRLVFSSIPTEAAVAGAHRLGRWYQDNLRS